MAASGGLAAILSLGPAAMGTSVAAERCPLSEVQESLDVCIPLGSEDSSAAVPGDPWTEPGTEPAPAAPEPQAPAPLTVEPPAQAPTVDETAPEQPALTVDEPAPEAPAPTVDQAPPADPAPAAPEAPVAVDNEPAPAEPDSPVATESDVRGGRASASIGGVTGVVGVAIDDENTAYTFGLGLGQGGRVTTGDVSPPPANTTAGLMARGSVSLGGPFSAGVAVDTDTTGQFSARAGVSLSIGRLSGQYNIQVDYDPVTGTFKVTDPVFGRYTWGNELFIAPTITVVVPNEEVDELTDQLQSIVDEAAAIFSDAPAATTGFEGSPEVGPDHAAAMNEPADNHTTGFEGSPEVGPDHAAATNEPADNHTTGFEGSPEVGPDHAAAMSDGFGEGGAEAGAGGGSDTDAGTGGVAGAETGSGEGAGEAGAGNSDTGDASGTSDTGGTSDSGTSDTGGTSDSGTGGTSDTGSDTGSDSDSGTSDSGGTSDSSDTGNDASDGDSGW